MFDALEKLGLKLEPGTRPVPVIVVDHVNRAPTADVAAGPAPTEFEVAEVRPSRSPARESLTALPNGQLEIMGYTLRRTDRHGIRSTQTTGSRAGRNGWTPTASTSLPNRRR